MGSHLIFFCRRGETALHHAVRGGDKNVVRLLLDHSIDVSKAGENGTARELALKLKREDLARILDMGGVNLFKNPSSINATTINTATTTTTTTTNSNSPSNNISSNNSGGNGSSGNITLTVSSPAVIRATSGGGSGGSADGTEEEEVTSPPEVASMDDVSPRRRGADTPTTDEKEDEGDFAAVFGVYI